MNQAPERKQQGRKPLPDGEGKTARVELRVKPETKAAWQAKAAAAGLTFAAWCEARLDKAK
jgi:predicted HicB family RNase H-like nuclease